MLPVVDTTYLAERETGHRVSTESNMICVLLSEFPMPRGLVPARADLLLRISPGYPDVPPDMWWFDPPVKRADGQIIPATDVVENYLGRSWQRWSRHLAAGQWVSGVDGIESFLAIIRAELTRCCPQ